MRLAVLFLLAFAAWSSPTSVFAQTPRVDHAAAGRVAFEAGRYRDALDHFQRAYELTSAPILLYNIGQSADRLRLDATTLRAFSLYLQRYPDAPNRDEVRHRMNALRPVVETQGKALAAEREKVKAASEDKPDPATLLPSPYAVPAGQSRRAAGAFDEAPARAERRAPSALESPWIWVAASVVVVSSVATLAVVATQ